mmetsp:Transcript_25473/g.44319  ORF Transcript_25473/g.44319 Transcript_25473/m.44319 type:complete len:459 (+) Transcript_25473:2641-4017(+)
MEAWQTKLNHQMENIGWGKFQYYVFAVCFTAWANDLMWMVGFGFILYIQADEWGLSTSDIGLYESIVFVGLLLGSYFWSYVADRYGRMRSFKRQIYILFIGALGMTCSISLGMIVPFAFFMGFAIGGELALGGTVYKEFIPASSSSTICILMIGFNVGNLIVALLCMMACAGDFGGLAGWRWMCIFMLVLEASWIVLRLKMPETPFFLASQGRMEECQEVLNQISMTNRGIPLEESLLDINPIPSKESPKVKKADDSKVLFFKLFQKNYLRPTLLFGLFGFMNDVPLVGVLFFMPEILAEVGSGGTTCFYSYMTSAIQQAACVPACYIAYKLLDTRMGRKWSIIIYTFTSGVFMFAFLLVQNFAGIVAVSSLCIAFNYMGWSGFYTMTPETYPTEIRSLGSGWIAIILKLASMVSPFITGTMIQSIGVTPVIILFAVLMCGAGMIGLLMKETRGTKTM